jgi:hypothetical protein
VKLTVKTVGSAVNSILCVPVSVASSSFDILLNLLGLTLQTRHGMTSGIVNILAESVGIFAEFASMVYSGALGVLDPDIVVESTGVSKPSNIGEGKVSRDLINFEEVVRDCN